MERDVGLSEQIGKAKRIFELGTACRAISGHLGFSSFLYAYRIPLSFTEPTQYVISGYPKAWRQRYDEMQYLLIDPVVSRAVSTSIPFGWDELDRKNEAVAQLFKEAAQHGLEHGLGAPVHGSHGSGGLLVMARKEPLPVLSDERERLLQEALWYSAQIHDRFRAILATPEALRERQKLTQRERQCLKRAADGQSAARIGKNMNLAERTVIYYLNRAGQKLGVRTRQHAVARAIALGEIHSDCYSAELEGSSGIYEVNR